MNNIYLIGFMGAGKSATSRELTKLLPFQLVEMDETIEKLCDMSIPEIFEKMGEQSFRDQESLLLKQLGEKGNQIVSCGGGVILREENVEYMKKTGTIVLLTATAQTVWERTKNNNNRPLLKDKKGPEDIQPMIDARLPKYQAAADLTVETDDLTSAQVAARIVEELARADKL